VIFSIVTGWVRYGLADQQRVLPPAAVVRVGEFLVEEDFVQVHQPRRAGVARADAEDHHLLLRRQGLDHALRPVVGEDLAARKEPRRAGAGRPRSRPRYSMKFFNMANFRRAKRLPLM
jgi:hypothetical protein